MLKAELQHLLDSANNRLAELTDELNHERKQCHIALDANRDLKHYRKSVEQARAAIDALIAVNCGRIVRPEKIPMNLKEVACDTAQEVPIDPLYSALSHLLYVLSTPSKATPRGY